jgi:four helix bundle protein
MRDVRKYEVFQLADQLVLDVYRVTAKFPKSEVFGMTGQMRRAAASIPMNLAEGAARAGAKEFAQFVNIAVGSLGRGSGLPDGGRAADTRLQV